jgi:hypothetical protein
MKYIFFKEINYDREVNIYREREKKVPFLF